MTATTVNVNAVVDEAKFKPFHLKIVLWCVFVVQAGMLASTALAGMMFGAMLFGMLADKIGRKNVILICVTLFSGFTFWGGFASGPTEFGILRFIAGLGIGGVLPNLVALTSEYAPQKMRSTLVTTMFSGYAVGGIMAALLGAWFTPSFGWEIMFYIAGIPLLMLPILYLYLPESLTFLVKKQQNEKASKIVQQISPEQNVTASTQFVLNEVHAPDASIAALFKQGRSMSTLLFWCCFFMCLLMVYALGSWLPKLMMAAGYSLGNSLMFLMAMNIGAVVGTIGGGILADRFHLKPVIIGMFLLGAVSLVGLGFNSPQAVIYLLVAAAGASAIGSSILLYSFVAQYYPLAIRSTGIGCASAVGRVGAIVGPIIIGFLLGMELPHKMNFLAVAIPAIIGAISVAMIVRKDLNAERNAETLLAKQKLNSIKT